MEAAILEHMWVILSWIAKVRPLTPVEQNFVNGNLKVREGIEINFLLKEDPAKGEYVVPDM